ncbi:hypothetical protein AB0K43_30940 [Kitasatospora sp. NPDC049258]|uniref:hypothetical protein n=1 Tax=Kitasatospora sp. NPDC049258 TaxID=3155394 RepID=UPI003431A40B
MTQPDTRPATTTAPFRPAPGDYVLYRDADRYLTGQPDHTQVCKVLPYGQHQRDRSTIEALATDEVFPFAPIAYMRPIDPAELMHDIDTAPLDALGDGRLMTAAGAWLATQRQQTGPGASPAVLPAVRD